MKDVHMVKARAVLLRKHWAQCKVKGLPYMSLQEPSERDMAFALRHADFNLVPAINKLFPLAYGRPIQTFKR